MKIEIAHKELLDVVYALRARTDVFERMPPPAEGAAGGPDHWSLEAANHRALADRLLAQAPDGGAVPGFQQCIRPPELEPHSRINGGRD